MSSGGLWLPVGIALSLAVAYTCSYISYNIFLHPLRHFPGPLSMRVTRIAYCYRLARGTLPFDMLDIHQQHGPVVRIAPDELAFADQEAGKEIMGHRIQENKRPEFDKSTSFYRPLGGPD